MINITRYTFFLMRYLQEKKHVSKLIFNVVWKPDLRDALLDAVGGGGDDRAVKASLLLEHLRQGAHVPGQHSCLDLETEIQESNR